MVRIWVSLGIQSDPTVFFGEGLRRFPQPSDLLESPREPPRYTGLRMRWESNSPKHLGNCGQPPKMASENGKIYRILDGFLDGFSWENSL